MGMQKMKQNECNVKALTKEDIIFEIVLYT